jgi:prephenate dehydrogenase
MMSSEIDSLDLPRTVVIAGVGLIGGSIGMRLRGDGLVKSVVGIGRNPDRLKAAMGLGAIDSYVTDWPSAMAEADAVILCGPVSSIAPSARQAWQARKSDDVWISDAGSTKSRIVEEIVADPSLARAFVGGHPIAGSERSGVEASRADLFQDRVCIVTPTEQSAPEAVAAATRFWKSLGSRVIAMTPSAHDAGLAMTSHMPHMIASALARSVRREDLDLAAGAFRDMTRVAAADGSLWADIFLSNRDFLNDSLDRHIQEVLHFKTLLDAGSSDALIEWWNEGRRVRAEFESRSSRKGDSA